MLPPKGAEKGGEKKAREAAQDGGTAGAGGAVTGGLASARPRFATSRTASLDEGEDEVDDDISTVRGERNVKDTLRQLKKTTSNTSGPSSPTSPTNVRPQPTPLPVDLPVFTDAFNHACYSLAELLGTSSDLQPANLHQLQLLPYGPRDWLLAFSVVRMSSKTDNYAQHSAVRYVSLKTFEILHYARHSRPEGRGWTRRWVKERTKRHSTAGATSKLHDVEDSVESGGRTRRGTERREGRTESESADGSVNQRVTAASEVLKGSDGALLKSHRRGPSTSHHRSDSASQSKRGGLTIAQPGSLPSSVPGTARAVMLLPGEEEDAIAAAV